MNDKAVEAGDVIYEISAFELIKSAGIQLVKWASDLMYTDAAYSEGWLEEHCERMATISEMLLVLFAEHQQALRDLRIDLPPGVYGVWSYNPLRGHSVSGEEEPVDPSSPTETGDTGNLPDFPF